MVLFQKVRQFLIAVSLVVFISTITTFGFAVPNSWATNSPLSSVSQSNHLIALGWGNVEAAGKNIEGKTQEAIGNITGDPKNQVAGKAKQIESEARNAAADAKDDLSLKGRAKAVTKNVEGKLQETAGKVTGNYENQAIGKAKQGESEGRNLIEDVKDKVQDMLN
jgi:uncharacterized protein YjbJ (UPF0337 family)